MVRLHYAYFPRDDGLGRPGDRHRRRRDLFCDHEILHQSEKLDRLQPVKWSFYRMHSKVLLFLQHKLRRRDRALLQPHIYNILRRQTWTVANDKIQYHQMKVDLKKAVQEKSFEKGVVTLMQQVGIPDKFLHGVSGEEVGTQDWLDTFRGIAVEAEDMVRVTNLVPCLQRAST